MEQQDMCDVMKLIPYSGGVLAVWNQIEVWYFDSSLKALWA